MRSRREEMRCSMDTLSHNAFVVFIFAGPSLGVKPYEYEMYPHTKDLTQDNDYDRRTSRNVYSNRPLRPSYKK